MLQSPPTRTRKFSPRSDYVNCQGAIYSLDRQAEATVRQELPTAIIITVFYRSNPKTVAIASASRRKSAAN
ncbi:hypothetical protein [Chamaesiphon polymorphus]|uniref:Uncharacterized protein n=1 Tax=Chamaesiphon polymorphus CCALA 037 TaxID=2107692 RepID=A0A2T1GNL4_9CYAN|nr:hypothetical protein [Chamaesiphon polymorphus]PSB59510.1 hypothetical protein C7B77_00510 [Chamaesiphon polymorphus CCALA 037]